MNQQFTAIATPDNADQSFGTWSCTVKGGASCSNPLTACPGVANNGCFYYKPATGETGVQIIAPPAANQSECTTTATDCTPAQPTVIANRVSGTYAFKFSGYDNSNGHHQVLAAGTFTATPGSNGNATISSGAQDVISWNGSQYAVTKVTSINGSYAPLSSSDPNSNNAGTLTLNGTTFQAVLDGSGNIQIVESDSNGTFWGVAEPTSKTKLNPGTTPWNFVFGFTGIDSTLARSASGGLLITDGNGNVTSGLMDTNDNGSTTTNSCAASPCTLTGGQYAADGSVSGLWHLQWSSAASQPCTGTDTTCQHFDFFVANGNASAPNPLALYAISTDPVDATHPAVLGTIFYQSPSPAKSTKYDNSAFKGVSISTLTGVDGTSSVVSLTLGGTDGTSTGTGGTGNFTGQFDQNDAGTILNAAAFPSINQTTNPYTYVSTNGNTGRYIFYMLGNPTTSTPTAPIPFVLYASGPNHGFLLDENSAAVMTGTMAPQQVPKQNGGFFIAATMVGTYAVATNSNSLADPASCSLMPSCAVSMSLLLTSPGQSVFSVGGTENPGNQLVNWNYDILTTGAGTISPIPPATTPNYVFYAVSGTNFYVIEEDKTVPSPILFMAQ